MNTLQHIEAAVFLLEDMEAAPALIHQGLDQLSAIEAEQVAQSLEALRSRAAGARGWQELVSLADEVEHLVSTVPGWRHAFIGQPAETGQLSDGGDDAMLTPEQFQHLRAHLGVLLTRLAGDVTTRGPRPPKTGKGGNTNV